MEVSAWPGISREGRDLYTRNLDPGHRVYGEDVRRVGTDEFRRWDPFRSKLAAYLLRRNPSRFLVGVRTVLYLGGGHGTTVSHLSDVLPDASIFVIEKSPTAFAPLLAVARQRTNLLPILADAQLPERYQADVGPVDWVYQDVAQRDQARIFSENASILLGPNGEGLLMLKVRSVTQSRPAAEIVERARRELTAAGWSTSRGVGLEPFTRDHVAVEIRR